MKYNTLAILSPDNEDALPLAAWFHILGTGRDDDAKAKIQTAFKLAVKKYDHIPQKNILLQRTFSIVDSLHKLHLDKNALVAATVYGLVTEHLMNIPEINEQFGKKVADLVEGVTKMDFINELKYGINPSNISTAEQTENLRKMILVMVEDVRVMLIKLAERVYDMRMLVNMPATQQRRIARETLDIFAPLANRLGIWQIKWELEDMALRYLKPDIYKSIAKELDGRRDNREKYIILMMDRIKKRLSQAGLKADVSGRPKHIYSIWNKMKQKNLKVHEVHDKLAVRILVDTETECYIALGIIHKTCPPVHGEFDDYIASPKNNDYKSLHTAVIADDQQIFEVQIRTHDMHYNSELGVAAHWRYKEAGNPTAEDKVFDKKLAWLRQVLTWQEEASNANDFIERFKSELLEQRVYILSPKGEIIDLPYGSTPIDYAYHIHTELGHRCRGSLVNTHTTPLNYILKTGDKVKILKAQESSPHRHWLNNRSGYIQTSRARTRVRQWFKLRDSGQHIINGRSALDKELYRLNIQNLDLDELASHFQYQNLDGFLTALGQNDLHIDDIINKLEDVVFPHKKVPTLLNNWQHNKDQCLLPAIWDNNHKDYYPVDIEVKADDRFGLLHNISSILTEEHINIRRVDTYTNPEKVAILSFTLEVKDLRQLSKALEKIDNLGNTISVNRKTKRIL